MVDNIFLDDDILLVDFDEDAEKVIKTIRDVDGVMLTDVEQWHVNVMLSGFKSIGVWEKIKAVYLMVGGTEATHRWNAKDMRDEDDAYRINWSGNWIHDEQGAKPIKGNLTRGFTNLFPNGMEEFHTIGFYTNESSTSDCDMGFANLSISGIDITARRNGFGSGDFVGVSGKFSEDFFKTVLISPNNSNNGLYSIKRNGWDNFSIWKNENKVREVLEATIPVVYPNTLDFTIGGNNSSVGFDNGNTRFELVYLSNFSFSELQMKQISYIAAIGQRILNRA